MKPGHTPDSRHGHAAEDCTSRWSGLRRLVAAALIAATAAGALAGCAGAKADADDGRHAAAEENSLPPGVMPPNDPPQPGDAPLGPDGHYDYSAPGFELKNPCDTDAYQVALQNGWEPPVIGQQFKDHDFIQYCGITRGTTGIGIYTLRLTHQELNEYALKINHQESGDSSWYTAVLPGILGDSCIAGVFGPNGGEGVSVGIGGFSDYSTEQSACDYASDQYEQLFGGTNAV